MTTQLHPEDCARILLYGVGGTGKTRLAATAADVEPMLPVLYIDVEGGISTIPKDRRVRLESAADLKNLPDDLSKVYIISASTYPEFVGIVNKLAELSKNKSLPWRTVIIDSVTQVVTMALYLAAGKDPNNPAVAIGAQIQHYGEVKDKVDGFLRAFKKRIGAHLIMTAETLVETNVQGRVTGYQLLAFKSAKAQLSHAPDFFGYMYVVPDKQERYVSFSPFEPKHIGKARDPRGDEHSKVPYKLTPTTTIGDVLAYFNFEL